MSTKDSIEILTLEHYLELKSQKFEFEGQSYLFWEYMRVLTDIRKVNPDVKFLLENVMMGEKWQRILTQAIGINPIEINSALVSAQNRRRLYWTNIGAEQDGLFGDLKCMIKQPKDKGILLKDILEPEVDEKYYLSESVTSRFKEQIKGSNVIGTTAPDFRTIGQRDEVYGLEGKMGCLNATDYKQPKQIQTIVHNTMPRSSKTGKGGTGPLSRNDGKTYCLDTGQTNAIQIVAMRGRNPENTSDRTKGCPTKQMLEPREDGKTNCITTVQKDNLVLTSEFFEPNNDIDKNGLILAGNMRGGKWENTHESSRRVYDSIGKGPTVATMQGGNQHPKTLHQSRIRRLTPLECERLQTMEDGYTSHVSDSQRYKMIGNGWTTSVISHILNYLDK
jgi:DNA (cytosine-5)-methyltransferase 3A